MPDKKLVGAHVVPEDAAYLSLYAVAERSSKSHIVRQQIERWTERHRPNRPITVLITTISKQIQHEWDTTRHRYMYTHKSNVEDNPFEYFKHMISLRLKNKGVLPEHINYILEQLHNEAD